MSGVKSKYTFRSEGCNGEFTNLIYHHPVHGDIVLPDIKSVSKTFEGQDLTGAEVQLLFCDFDVRNQK